MSEEFLQDEQALRLRVEDVERALTGLEGELADVDRRLHASAGARQRFELLATVCDGLDKLEELDAADLFWNGQIDIDLRLNQVRLARGRLVEFAVEIEAVDCRREDLVDKIATANHELDCLHYELRDALDREESRQSEWLVEREADPVPYRPQVMPWARGMEEDRRYRYSLAASILVSVLLGWLVNVIDLPVFDRETAAEVPERVAKLVRQERRLPPPVEEPVLAEEEPPKPDEPIDPPETLPEEPTPLAAEPPQVAQAEQPDPAQQVRSKGILAFRESFAERANLEPTASLGLQARVTDGGDTATGRPERMMVSTSAPGSSGGINLAAISRDVGGGGPGIGGVQVSRVASSIGGAEGPDRPLSAGSAAGRTDEEIQIVFDRYKAALYRLYNRELRKDPTLRGQMVLKLTIEPDGRVSLCQLHSSDMGAPALADQVVDRVLGFDFGAKVDIVAMTIIYPIDFLPTA